MSDSIKISRVENKEIDKSLPIDLTREFMIEKCDYFAGIGIWPMKSILDPDPWLNNFKENELDHALYLLNSFLYFSKPLMDEVFAGAIRTLSRLLMTQEDNCDSLKTKWKRFIDSAIVTYPTGEIPNPTDSGFQFARKARAMGIREGSIKTPEQVVSILETKANVPVIIVDDFIGTGHQFFETWDRPYGAKGKSLREVASITPSSLYACPAFCTEYALGELRRECPKLIVNPGHLIPKNYSVLAEDSIVWPAYLRHSAIDFIQSASARAGIPDTEGSTPEDWRGFGKLGLTIAFEDTVPDATLPLFSWEENGWHPLIRRTTL